MKINFSRWIISLSIAVLIFCVPLGGTVSAFGGQNFDNIFPLFQVDGEGEPNTNNILYLIIGAFVIVLIIMGAVLLRRPK